MFSLTLPRKSSGLSWCLSHKESTFHCRRHEFNPQVGKIPWRRAQQPTPILLPGGSHGQRSLAGCSPWGHKESDTTWPLNSNNIVSPLLFQPLEIIVYNKLALFKSLCGPCLLIGPWLIKQCQSNLWYSVRCVSFSNWDWLGPGTSDSLLQCLHLDKCLFKQQKYKETKGLKITTWMCGWDKLWIRYKKTEKTQLSLLKGKILCMPLAHNTIKGIGRPLKPSLWPVPWASLYPHSIQGTSLRPALGKQAGEIVIWFCSLLLQ